ncbi:MAG: hypothetical protein Kow0029_03840 [Candidatus Rifleibacteriota bacterium]
MENSRENTDEVVKSIFKNSGENSKNLLSSQHTHEKNFRRAFALDSISHLRNAILIGGILYTIFGIQDYLLLGPNCIPHLLIRLAIFLPASIALYLMTFSKREPQNIAGITYFWANLAGLGMLGCMYFTPPQFQFLYFIGFLLTIWFSCIVCGNSSRVFIFAAIFQVILFNFTAQLSGYPADLIFYSNLLAIACSLLAFYQYYIFEEYARKSYAVLVQQSETNKNLEKQLSEQFFSKQKFEIKANQAKESVLKVFSEMKMLRQALEQIQETVFILEPDGLIQYCNPVAAKMLSGDRKKHIYYWQIFSLKENQDAAKARIGSPGEFLWQGKIQDVTLNGSRRFFNAFELPIKNENHELIKIICILKDTTKEAELEESLQRNQRLQALGTLAGGVAHDFNNILHIIQSFTYLLKQAAGEEHSSEINSILQATKRAKDIIKQILAYSRLEANPHDLHPVKPGDVIAEIAALMRSTLPTKIVIRTEIQTPDAMILADEGKVHQILMNLCINAYRAISGYGEIFIKFCFNPENPDELRISVSDTGCGMDAETLHRIFDPYFTTWVKEAGTGLGLSIVNSFVRSFNGRIEVESKVGQGTTFYLYFPMLKEKDLKPSEENRQADLDEGIKDVFNPLKIFIIDDEPMITMALSKSLSKMGYSVTSFNQPEEALNKLMTGNFPDVILTDQTMPEISGSEIIETIRAAGIDLPVLLCSGFNDDSSEKLAKECRFVRICQKPIEPEAIGHILQEMHHEFRQQQTQTLH